MFFHENKILILSAVAGLVFWLCVVFMFINSNWSLQGQKQKETETARQNWDGYFSAKAGQKMLPKNEAEKEIEDSNSKLKQNLVNLQRIEFGTIDTLKLYQEAAAGKGGDSKSYLIQQRQNVADKSNNQWFVKVPGDLDLVSRADDPVSLNLLRVAMADRFLLACKEANVLRVVSIKYAKPSELPMPELKTEVKDAKEAKFDPRADKKGDKKDAPPPEALDKLVQFPMRVQVIGPERALAQLLYEVQKPSDSTHGYFCLNSVRVEVNDAASGTVKATLSLSALLTQKLINDMQIKLKTASGGGNGSGDDEPRPRIDRDTDRY